MKSKEIILDAFTIVGISVRTTNQNHKSQEDIAKLWESFFLNGVVQSVPNKVSNDVYCIYTDYESDYTGEYTTFIGYRVSGINGIPTNKNLIIKDFPACKYLQYTSEGELPYAVGKTWAHIWQSNINRAYIADFDIYGEEAKDPGNAKITTFLSIK
ncbi:MAG: GyrI-like domain-containing protein [Prevotella sp.]|jgi:predicted transcriptional regulator YdeE|nr:GyrI-like domain-containing protein [Prevotella sp.]